MPAHNVDVDLVETAMAGRTLSLEQQAMVAALATADGLAVVVGQRPAQARPPLSAQP